MEPVYNNGESSAMGPRPLATKPVYNRRPHTLKNGIIESRPTMITPRKRNLKYTSFKKPIHDTLVQPNAKYGRKLYRSMLRDRSFLNDIKLVLKDKLAKLKEEHAILQDMLNYNEEETQDIPPLFDDSPSTYEHQQSYESDQDNNALQFILSQLEHTVSTPMTEYTPLTTNYANQILNANMNYLPLDLRAAQIESILGHNNDNSNNNNIGGEITDFERLEYVLDDYSDNELQQENNNNILDSNGYYNVFGMTVDEEIMEDDNTAAADNDDNDDNDDDGDDGDTNHGIEDDESARQALSLLIAKYGI